MTIVIPKITTNEIDFGGVKMKKKFKTESQQLLNLMINSIYTNKEIFLRELISNASDAIDKHHYESLTNKAPSRDYFIRVDVDKKKRTITITDNGIGMNYDDLSDNLGTIARSGTKEFLQTAKKMESIGQFGVGFYSAFMIADKVDVYSRKFDSDQTFKWSSDGTDTYSVAESTKEIDGTQIVLYVRDSKDYDYAKFLEDYKLRNLIKQYSDYIRYPVQMVDKDGKLETVNSMIPIWKKGKKELTEDKINEFYKHKFMEFDDPLISIHTKAEGRLTYNAMLFVPKKAPFDIQNKSYEKGLQLYSKGIFVKDKAKELVPEWMLFVKGIVDSADLDLNISRETIQESKVLTQVGENLETKLKKELEKLITDDREKYQQFWQEYGLYIKYGVYEMFGAKKELLQDLLLFSTNTRDSITFKEYVDAMKEGQKSMYYATGSTKDQILSLPQMDALKKKEYEVLLFTQEVDEFMIQMVREYAGFSFKSVNHSDLDLLNDKEKKELEKVKEQSVNLLTAIKDELQDFVDEVVISSRLTDSPLCLVSDESMSFEMEKVLAQMPNGGNMKAKRILELNPKHSLFQSLETAYNKDPLSIQKYAILLLTQAQILDDLKVDDPKLFSERVTDLIVQSIQ
jgi:molecular chaperone HtpG